MISRPLYTFHISRGLGERDAIEGVRRIAEWVGIVDRRFAYSYPADGACRISCSRDMAECLIEAWRIRARDAAVSRASVIECEKAIESATRALSAPSR